MWEWQEHYSEYEMNAEMGHSRPRTHEDPTPCHHTQPGVYVRGDRRGEPPYYRLTDLQICTAVHVDSVSLSLAVAHTGCLSHTSGERRLSVSPGPAEIDMALVLYG